MCNSFCFFQFVHTFYDTKRLVFMIVDRFEHRVLESSKWWRVYNNFVSKIWYVKTKCLSKSESLSDILKGSSTQFSCIYLFVKAFPSLPVQVPIQSL